MNEVDIAIIIVTGLSALFGLWRGLVKEVLSLLAWIAALLVARVYSDSLADLLVNMIESDSVRYVTAFALLFVLIMMLGTLLNHMMAKLLNISGLKLLDRLLGGAFGIARGGIIVLVILFITSAFVAETELWQQSTLVPYGMAMIDWSRLFIEDLNTVNAGP
jgi:membrane protein required for colicin V production